MFICRLGGSFPEQLLDLVEAFRLESLGIWSSSRLVKPCQSALVSFHLYLVVLFTLGVLISSSRVIRIGLWSDPSASITRQAHLSIRLELTSDTSGVDIESTDLLYLVGVPSLRQDMSLMAS